MPYTLRMKPLAPWSWNTAPIICSPSRETNPPCAHRLKHSSRLRRAIFPPLESTPTKTRVQQINKKRHESRSICTAPVTAEQVCFPLAEQAALLLRQTEGRKDELVALITSLEPSRLDARNWLRLTGIIGALRAVCISAWISPTTTTAAGCAMTMPCWFSE